MTTSTHSRGLRGFREFMDKQYMKGRYLMDVDPPFCMPSTLATGPQFPHVVLCLWRGEVLGGPAR